MVFIAILLIYKFVLSSDQSTDYYNALQREKEAYSSALAKHQEDTQSFIPILQLKQAVPKYMEEEDDMAKVLIIRDLYKLKNIVISDDSSIKTGYSENSFSPFLKSQFGERIKTKKKVSNSSTLEAYFPDFIYVDNIRQIYLDIEIDEPYDLQTGKPIHCHFDDSIRNNFFVENYWSVIRFSEKQVVSEPENCIKTIQSIITALENGHSNWISYNTEDNTWDKEAAIKMEEGGYREAYLGIEKQVRIIPIESPFTKKSRLDIDELMRISPRFDFRPRSSDPDDDLPF
jgi:very-short-patch-repair endonuclease